MIVFFTCPTNQISKRSSSYRKIRNEIIEQGHSINHDWIDYSINCAKKGIPGLPPQTLYKEVMSAILTADAVVIDATVKSMAVGHQITFALLKNKPLLFLRHKEKGKEPENIFIEGSESPYLNFGYYESENDIPNVLKNFFRKYEKKSKKRFNLVLTGSQDNYLNWASFTYRKPKTEIIHKAINRTEEKDSSYQKYLNKES